MSPMTYGSNNLVWRPAAMAVHHAVVRHHARREGPRSMGGIRPERDLLPRSWEERKRWLEIRLSKQNLVLYFGC